MVGTGLGDACADAKNNDGSQGSECSERNGSTDGTADDGGLVVLLGGSSYALARNDVEILIFSATSCAGTLAGLLVLHETLAAAYRACAVAIPRVENERGGTGVGAHASARLVVLGKRLVADVGASTLAGLLVLG